MTQTRSKTRLLAPLSLVAAVLLFAVTLPWTDTFIGGLLHAFAEAGMIGGLADWFAVVALFRHPFGIPIPHTAILPRHRARITTGIIDMVQNRWLTKETILERLASWNVAAALMTGLADPGTREGLLRMLRGTLRDLLRDMDDERFARRAAELLRENIRTGDLLRWLRAAGERGMQDNWHLVLFSQAVTQASGWLNTPEVRRVIVGHLRDIAERYADNPVRRLGKWMAESVNAVNYDDLAEAIVRTLGEELERMRGDKAHPARKDFEAWLSHAVSGIESNEELRAHVDGWRDDLLESGRLHDVLRGPVSRARAWLLEDLAREESIVMQQLGDALFRALDRFAEDAEAQQRLDTWIKERAAAFVDRNHGEIGRIVQRNLERLDDEQMVRQIEDKVGGDLQYIRVNGAIVGGMVGAVIYLAKYFFM